MKTLHNYLTRQVLLTLMMTVAVFVFVLLLGNILKDVLGPLVSGQTSLLLVGEAVGLLIPWVLVFALPMGMLTAALLVFGRFSADNELTATKASGVSLLSLITPLLLLSASLSLVCLVINCEIAPQCRVAFKRLLNDMVRSHVGLLLPEKTFVTDFKNLIVYVDKVDGTNLHDIRIYNLKDDKLDNYMRASSGWYNFDLPTQVITVHLLEFWQIELGMGKQPVNLYDKTTTLYYTNKPPEQHVEGIKLTEMTFSQLKAQYQDLERRMLAPMKNLTRADMNARMRQMVEQQKSDLYLLKLQMHRQISFSFACIAFTLVGIPLGIRAHRRETTFGIALSLILVLVYYSFFIVGQALDSRPDLAPHLLLWMPNFIFQAVGAVLLWRANRGL